jgi:sugar/nucleoside kinase (ribokinase family)
MAPDGLALAAVATRAGVRNLLVTMGKRGVVYFAEPGFERLDDLRTPTRPGLGPIRTALVPATEARVPGPGDPTGCGDVWGATYFSRLLAGDIMSDALRRAMDAAARNVEHRGATGLAQHLRGELHTP